MSHAGTLLFIKLRPSPQPLSDAPAAKQHFELTRSLMTSLGGLLDHGHDVISLEIVAKSGRISYVLGIPPELSQAVTHHLYAAFPTCELEPLSNWALFDGPGEIAGATVQFSPADGALRSDDFTGSDPLSSLLEVLSNLGAHERLCLQLLLGPAGHHGSLADRIVDGLYSGLTSGARNIILGSARDKHHDDHEEDKEDKTHTAAFRANLRVIAAASSSALAATLVKRAAAAYHGLTVAGKTKLRYELPAPGGLRPGSPPVCSAAPMPAPPSTSPTLKPPTSTTPLSSPGVSHSSTLSPPPGCPYPTIYPKMACS